MIADDRYLFISYSVYYFYSAGQFKSSYSVVITMWKYEVLKHWKKKKTGEGKVTYSIFFKAKFCFNETKKI